MFHHHVEAVEHSQTKVIFAAFCGVIWLVELGQVFLWDTRPVVFYGQHQVAAVAGLAALRGDAAVLVHGLHGVDEQVVQHLHGVNRIAGEQVFFRTEHGEMDSRVCFF